MNSNPLRKRPWLLVVVAIGVFVTANVAMLVIALRNQPVPVSP